MAGALGEQLIEVVTLADRQAAQGEVVEDQQIEACQAPQPRLPAAVGASAGQFAQHAARLGKEHRVATPAGGMPERAGDVRLAHPDRAVEQHRFAALDEAQGGQVADQRRRQRGVVAKVELLEGEPRPRSVPGGCARRAPWPRAG